MVIKEIQQDTLPVLLPGFSWGSLPAAEILEEEIQGGSPHHRGGDDAEERDEEDLLGAAKLHDDVEGQVEQQVTDEDAQHVGSKVPGSVDESKEGEGPVNQIPHYQQHHSVHIQRPAALLDAVCVEHHSSPPENPQIYLETTHVIDLGAEGQRG